MALLEIRNLTKVFPQGESAFSSRRAEIRAVDGVSLDIQAGETIRSVGESGSGKSTLGRLALRLIEPTSGTVLFDGHNLLRVSHTELRHLRRHMQIIFQDPFSSLDPRMRVEDLVAEPLLIHKGSGIARARTPMPPQSRVLMGVRASAASLRSSSSQSAQSCWPRLLSHAALPARIQEASASGS